MYLKKKVQECSEPKLNQLENKKYYGKNEYCQFSCRKNETVECLILELKGLCKYKTQEVSKQ